jgi:hypothetical protein
MRIVLGITWSRRGEDAGTSLGRCWLARLAWPAAAVLAAIGTAAGAEPVADGVTGRIDPGGGWVMFQSDLGKTALTLENLTSVQLSGSGGTVRFLSGESTLLGRMGGELSLIKGLRLDVGLSDVGVNRGGTVSTLNVGGVERAVDSKLADATFQLDAIAAGPLTLVAMAGGRGALLDVANRVGSSTATPIAVAGGGLALTLGESVQLRGGAVTAIESLAGSPYTEGKVQAVWRLSSGGELSLGWQHLSGTLPVLDRSGSVRRNAIMMEYRIGF